MVVSQKRIFAQECCSGGSRRNNFTKVVNLIQSKASKSTDTVKPRNFLRTYPPPPTRDECLTRFEETEHLRGGAHGEGEGTDGRTRQRCARKVLGQAVCCRNVSLSVPGSIQAHVHQIHLIAEAIQLWVDPIIRSRLATRWR